MRLSPITCYYIRKLWHQSPDAVKNSSALKANSSADALANVDEVLQNLYSSATELSTVIQRLESLVYLHKSIQTQTSLYTNYTHELTKMEQQIFQLLGIQTFSA